jgi:isoquinoline 1-oxidoreductase beta subunit
MASELSHPRSNLSRRRFLQTTVTAGASLALGLHLPQRHASAAMTAEGAGPFEPNAFVRITQDDLVTVMIKHIEFGQGPLTGLATLVAEELDADWGQMRAVLAPADATLYAHTYAPVQFTGGSTAMASAYTQMRKAGAAARAMLLGAAAEEWGVPAASLRIEAGVVKEPRSGRTKRFGELVAAASKQTPPSEVTLKSPADFKLIGTRIPKLDTQAKTTGQAVYTIDVKRPGMLTTLVAHPPRFGARVRSVNDEKARAVAGVEAVEVIPEGVAVYGNGYWSAKQGRDLLEIEWDDGAAETRDSARVIIDYQALARKPGLPASAHGDAADALGNAETVIESEFIFPFLAHAPMEPLDCVIEKKKAGYEIWMGSQGASRDRAAFAEELNVGLEDVKLNIQFAGGSFGRRSQHKSQFAREAAHAISAIDGRAPIKLIWSREDDIQGGFYRPIYVHRLKGGLDAKGEIVAWQQVVVGQSVQKGGSLESLFVKNGVDLTSVEGVSNLSYAVPNLDVSLHSPELGVPVLWWRSVGHTHTAYTSETFIDELLSAGKRDAVAGRLALLGKHPRHRAVLSAVAEMANWGGKVPEGRARGVAVHESFGSYVAQIAEVSRSPEGSPKVERVWCAIDCGIAINPDIVKAQMEGGIGFGLGAALLDEISLKSGRVVQSNFHDYRPIRIDDMPDVEVRVLASGEAPSGVGEPGVPPIAPAVANAWAALTGDRLRRLPFRNPAA